jgi:hypothetical protein
LGRVGLALSATGRSGFDCLGRSRFPRESPLAGGLDLLGFSRPKRYFSMGYVDFSLD